MSTTLPPAAMTHGPNSSHRRHVPKTTAPTRLTNAMASMEPRAVIIMKNIVRVGVLSSCTVVAAVWSMLNGGLLLEISSPILPKLHKHPAAASRPSVR